MKLIVGLGNPGRRYDKTRHNIGATIVNRIAEDNDALLDRKRFDAQFGIGSFWDGDILLLLPQAYMNRSGLAVCEFLRWKNAALADMLVVCDDTDLPLGDIRIRRSGSSGGHNGLGSIIDTLGHEEFPRLRVGIGRSDESGDLSDYVLAKFAPDEFTLLRKGIEEAVSCCEGWARCGITVAMNKFNRAKERKKGVEK